MINLWQHIREFIPMAAVIALCLIVLPTAQATTTRCTTATTQQTTATLSGSGIKKAEPQKDKPKADSKSVLDAEVLASPFTYFRNAFFSEESEERDVTANPGVLMLAIKALFATLLSTIL